jgi:type IV secretion system protein VirB10
MYGKLIDKLGDIEKGGEIISKKPDFNVTTTSFIYNNLPPVQISVGERISGILDHKLISGKEESPVIVISNKDYYDDDNKYVIFPQGTRFIGKTKIITYKASKKMYVWFERMILPNKVNVVFPKSQRLLALSKEGILGIVSNVNSHFLLKYGSAILVGVLDGLSGLAQNRMTQDSGASYMIDKSSRNFSDINKQIFEENSNIVPTITVNAGTKIFVHMSTNLIISPYCLLNERSYYRRKK